MDTDFWNIDRNIHKARQTAIDLLENDFAYFCPHLNSYHFEQDCKATWEDYLKMDLVILGRCDALLLLDNWTESKGAKTERGFALKHNIPVFFSIDNLKEHFNGNK